MAEQTIHPEEDGSESGAATGDTGTPEPVASAMGVGSGTGAYGAEAGNYSTTPGVGDFGTLPGPSDFGTPPGPEDYGTPPGGGRINLGMPNGGSRGADESVARDGGRAPAEERAGPQTTEERATPRADERSGPQTEERSGRRAAGDGGVVTPAGSEAPDLSGSDTVQTGNYGTIPYGDASGATP